MKTQPKFTKSKPQVLQPDDFLQYYSFKEFNSVQRECSFALLNSTKNCLIIAPTASGKTVLLDFALYQCFGRGELKEDGGIAVYVAPTKALCREKMLVWIERLQRIYSNMVVQEVNSDTDLDLYHDSFYPEK